MESELAKTLRAMSYDHRMVPDFSEQLLDIADAIESQAKERDAALAEVERLKARCEKQSGMIRTIDPLYR